VCEHDHGGRSLAHARAPTAQSVRAQCTSGRAPESAQRAPRGAALRKSAPPTGDAQHVDLSRARRQVRHLRGGGRRVGVELMCEVNMVRAGVRARMNTRPGRDAQPHTRKAQTRPRTQSPLTDARAYRARAPARHLEAVQRPPPPHLVAVQSPRPSRPSPPTPHPHHPPGSGTAPPGRAV
jgi:hypothetical protein